MTFEIRDVLTIVSILVAAVSMLLVNRNARRATAAHTQNADLTRIRDLRQELAETKRDLDTAKEKLDTVNLMVTRLSRQLSEASEAALTAYREREEMRRYARMPGMDIETWLARFGQPPLPNGRD